MKVTNIQQKIKEKRSNNTNKTKVSFADDNFIIKKASKKWLPKAENECRQIKSKFINKLELPKDKEIYDNKSVKEENYNKYLPFNSDKKIRQNSVFQDLIVKILEINHTDSSHKNNSSDILLRQKEVSYSKKEVSYSKKEVSYSKKEGSYSNSINSIKKIRKSVQSLPQIKNKNIKHDLLKSKNNINAIYKSASQDFRKHSNIKTDSSNSFIAHQSEDEYKYNSSITDNFKIHLKKPDIFFGFNQVSGSSSSQQITFRVPSKKNLDNFPLTQRSCLKNNNNEIPYNLTKRQKEIAQSIIELDLNKLQKEIYEYENTDITDAINKLPTHKFESDSNKNSKRNMLIKKHFKIKNNNKKKSKNYIKNIKERFRILRRAGYVYDSLDDEEYEDEEDNNFYFEPDGYFILILDFIILVTSLFDLVFLPIHLSFSPFNEKNLIKGSGFFFIDIIFIVDFISGFFRAYFNFDEDLIKNSVLIIQHFLKTWFLLDFICGIPVYSILIILRNKFKNNNNCYGNYYFDCSGRSLYHLLELVKLLKLIKAVNANAARKNIKIKLKKINFFYNWGHFMKQVFKFISVLNFSSCLFIFSARNSYPNWILNLNMNAHNFISVYICSCYYIITTITTVGYGDIQILSMTERIFEILFLIIGTCLYSWMLTSTSNYIKKINEKNINFEHKKEILDDIKTNYPLMSKDLYCKIFKVIYYKKSHKDVDKNIIIDLLPYSIKNNLLIQMYYPIITNFKFFKYFENSEFIIEIVSVLKPFVGMKGDLLINEGDYVEDIIFNKTGILSLEIFIDLNNPREFIKEYLIKYNLEDIKNLKSLGSDTEFNSTFGKNSLNTSYYSKGSFNFNKMNNSSFKSNNMNFLKSIRQDKNVLDKEKKIKKKFQYLKIINIREKEHFGDVLMFLNEPSPLNVRVNSKNAEVLLLNKTDVVEISSNFPNIWKRVNESSIFNLEQIKNLIMRKLSIFCFANGIKIKYLYSQKDKKTGQNKIKYSLIPIPDKTREETLITNINLNENNNYKNSKESENNSSLSFENFKKKNTFVIKEVQSSEESRTNTNSLLTKENKYSYENSAMSKKGLLKKLNESIKISNQIDNSSEDNIHRKRKNKYYDQNITGSSQDRSFSYSKSYNNFCQNKSSFLSKRHTKDSVKSNRTKSFTNFRNAITNENNSSKSSNSFKNNSPKMNNSVVSFTKGIKKYQNFAEKSKMNKKLITIPSFSFMQSFNNNINCELEGINDEIYPNENFEIKIPDNDQNLIINNNNNNTELQNNSISNFLESPKNLLISDNKNHTDNIIKEVEKQIDISNNYNTNNKFNNLQISPMSSFEIKSSYDNINELTNYKFILNDTLIKKTKIFLSRECSLLYDTNTKSTNMPHLTPTNNRRSFFKCLQNKKSYDYTINNNLFVVNDNEENSTPPFSKELKKLGFKKNDKNNENFFENFKEFRRLNKSFADIKRNNTIKEKNELFKKGISTCKNMHSSLSPKKGKIKADISSNNSLISIKTKNKLDLITKNMKRDNQNLNNPNEFYAVLFNNIYKKKIKKYESQPAIPKVKVKLNTKEKNSSEDNVDKDKEDSLCDN